MLRRTPLKKKKETDYYSRYKKAKKSSSSGKRKWINKLDKIFSLYIRLRDSKAYGFEYFRCPTCGRVLPFEEADCSHFYSRANMATRFDEDNTCAECRYDNRFNSSHLIELGEFIKKRIGEQRFALLRVKAHSTKKWSEWELEQLCKYYQKKIEEIKAQ